MRQKLLFGTVIATLLLSGRALFSQTPDSCLRLLGNAYGDTTWENPDSVKVDSCTSSPTFGQLYAKGRFVIQFTYYILPTPIGPEDTIIDRTWEDIDTLYANVRAAFDSLEQKYGGFFFRKIQPHWNDTASGGDKLFSVWFNNYVNIDSAVEALADIPLIELSVYFMRAGRYLAGVNDAEMSNLFIPKKALLLRSNPLSMDQVKHFIEFSQTLFIHTIDGRTLFQLSPNSGYEELMSRLLDLTNGSYIIRGSSFALIVNLTD